MQWSDGLPGGQVRLHRVSFSFLKGFTSAHAVAAALAHLREAHTVYLELFSQIAYRVSRYNGAELNRVKLFPF